MAIVNFITLESVELSNRAFFQPQLLVSTVFVHNEDLQRHYNIYHSYSEKYFKSISHPAKQDG
ncbi:MAG: hypothetical protein PF518_13180 [Spirochaetaceae bacterium]|nr:hypothetical protein [Spirochaetaceae bacterium]